MSPAINRIAMWSPPRARSTLMMRVFEALGCAVIDEPFYAYWLKAVQKTDDPGYHETLAGHETNWRVVTEQIQASLPAGVNWCYQKHMAIHMLPEVDLSWLARPDFVHGFLLRDPREVIASMVEFRDLARVHREQGAAAAAELVGIVQLERIFDRVVEVGVHEPLVIDANEVLQNPMAVLGAFCRRIDLPFNEQQPIEWAAGQHASDGAWAPFWYQKIFATTKLTPYRATKSEFPRAVQEVVDQCMPTYERLYAQRLQF